MKILIDVDDFSYTIIPPDNIADYRREAAISIGLLLNAASQLLQNCGMAEDEAFLFLEIALEGLKNDEPIDENDPRIQKLINH